jgi:hypothetical protein
MVNIVEDVCVEYIYILVIWMVVSIPYLKMCFCICMQDCIHFHDFISMPVVLFKNIHYNFFDEEMWI